MITTVCMNPSFDKTASVSQLLPGDVNRLQNVRVDVGGKGINVAIVLQRLGIPVHCVGCLGAENQDRFLRMIEQENVTFDYLSVSGEVRTNLKLLDEAKKIVTEFNESGIELSADDQFSFFTLLSEKASCSEYVVFSGRLPRGCDDTVYQKCMQVLPEQKIVLDTSGEPLLHGLKEKPYLIKPNLPELEAVIQKELRTLGDIRDAGLKLIEYGAQNVVVSMGKDGAMLVNDSKTLYAPALSVEVRSTVGAGDSMVGGILYGLACGESICESFRFGVAAGSASVMTDGTLLVRKSDFDTLLPKVMVQKV